MRLPLFTGTTVIAIAACLTFSAQPLAAQTTGGATPTAAAFPRQYAGNCPAAIEFIGHVTVTVAGTRVDYQWERSNGTSGKVLHGQIGAPAAGAAPRDTAKPATITAPVVSDHWRVALPGRGGQFWEKLHILAPVDLRSAAALVDVDCRE